MFQTNPVLQRNTSFEFLYDTYAPKVLGFINGFAESKEQADRFLIDVFTRVSKEIKPYDNNTEKKILQIVLTVYRTSQNLHKFKNSSIAI